MLAAVLTELNAPLTLAEVTPCELQFGQVLVDVLMSGICGAQLAEIRGEKGNAKFLPHLLGHEGAGRVVKIGDGVTKVKPGDKVIMHWRKGSGVESPFPQYIYQGEKIQSGKVTTFSEQSICSENRLTKVEEKTPAILCALLGCGLSTALATIENEAEIKMGESLLIIGCGGLGLNLILAAKMRSVWPITVCDIVKEKAKLADKMGVRFAARIDDLPASFRADVIIDTAGNSMAMAQALRCLAPGGRYIMVGQPQSDVLMSMPVHMFEGDGKTIKATQGGGFMPDQDIPRYIRLFHAGLLNLNGIVSKGFTLSLINSALDLVRQGNAGRIMISMKPE